MTLSDIDRQLLDRCLNNEPDSWEAFIDRFLGLVVHVINHTASSRGMRISVDQRDDLVADVFMTLVQNDYGVLRRFRRKSSLATYLTIIARRVISHKLSQPQESQLAASPDRPAAGGAAQTQIENREQLEQMLSRLDPKEADVIRLHHLEGKSYQEISTRLGMPENSVGPLLSRAREKMRTAQATD